MYSQIDLAGFIERLSFAEYCELRQFKIDVICDLQQGNTANFKRQERLIKDVNSMAREVKKHADKKSDTTRNQGRVQTTTKWVDYDIRTKEHKERIREMAKDVDTVLDQLVMCVDDGHDLIVKRGDGGSTVRAMFFCNVAGHPHCNHGLSAAAPDAWLAVVTLVYKHVVGFEGQWTTNSDDQDDLWR